MNQTEKERVLRQMVGASGSVGEKVPLEYNDEPLDAAKYWVQYRTPSGWQLDDLRALLQRERIDRDVRADDDSASRLAESRYMDGRVGPVLWKAIEYGLIADARLPNEVEDSDEVGVYEWSSDNDDNAAWVRSRKGLMFYMLAGAVVLNVLHEADEVLEDVVPEGEDSAAESDLKSSETEAL